VPGSQDQLVDEPVTPGPTGPADVAGQPPRGLTFRRLAAKYGLLVGLAALIALFGALEPDAFFTVDNLKSTVTIGAPLLVLAVGLTVPLSMGEFDLSISAATQLWSVLIITFISVHGLAWGLSVAAVLVIGALTGALIGLVIVWSGVNAFIVTLGVGTVMAGLEFAVAKGKTLYQDIPPAYTKLGVGEVAGIPTAGIIAAIFCALVWLITERTVAGRRMRAVGGNPEAARLCGVRVDLLRTLGFVSTGVAGVLAALLITAQASSYYPNAATAMLLPAYAACFLGTTVFRSNIFDVAGTVVGVVFLAVVQNGLLVLGVPSWTAQVAQGAVLVVAVVASKLASGTTR
jgi:ribose transport system permease protein